MSLTPLAKLPGDFGRVLGRSLERVKPGFLLAYSGNCRMPGLSTYYYMESG